jgi:hypothetical protein
VPSQTSDAAKATTDRSASREAAIGFSPTTTMSGAPYETERIAKVIDAATHEARLSMLPGKPPAGNVPAGGLRNK